MPDKIEKALRKLSAREREQLKLILQQVQSGQFQDLDVKKLKNRDDMYRVRKGSLRIIFHKDKKGQIFILSLERRSDTTYHF